ncbi:Acetyl-CoA:oxalate CoA-transferase [Microbacterium oxydans]|uniref:Formyl-coenzyme A transferase n=1 Tax=Microbacterium oxydans TaxID=82380 RepID=A0A0F0L7B1_9MICO|nr:CoA transferase [Microbacterium oxydans]KJL29038.1 Formyl-coenzyme A transferase [Microbacterium oxydans]CAH0161850.1 Acetyl-CoA:oxalate CoA-transferase [Microbacterium oxydans]
MTSPASALLGRIFTELGLASRMVDIPTPASSVPLPSRLATGDLAWASVGAATLTAHRDAASIDSDRIATAYRSDRFLTLDGAAPSVWSPFSGFWRTADGWIRTHGNYPHHAARLRAGLRLDDTADASTVTDALAAMTATDAVTAIGASGGLAVHVSPERPEVDAALRETPLIEIRRLGDAPRSPARTASIAAAPLAGIRVLDLTRVIAGPVGTRTLALLGADVLRIDPPELAEPEWQHLDTGHGKRSARLDARSPEFSELLSRADVVVLGYRPASLARLGLSPAALIERHPDLIVAQLSAWGIDHPDRAGFDSLVQAESGIALIESPDGEGPGALPAQALDHSAGYLLAAAISALVERRAAEGGSWLVRTSLRRVAAELLGMPRRAEAASEPDVDPSPHLQRFDVDGVELITARSAVPGGDFAAPHPWGSDQPAW